MNTNQVVNSIHPNAKLGEGVVVESFSTIYDDVEIGEGTWVGPNVTIFPGARIGKNCKIFPGAVIAAEPQDLKFSGEYSTVEVGDNTVIRECVTIHRATVDKLVTKVGSNCLLMAYVHLAHDVEVGNHVIIANGTGIAGHVTIEDHAIIEGMVGVQQFVRIGAHSFIGGSSNVRKNVPPYIKAAREPLSYVGVNSIGLRRRGYSDDQVKLVEGIYRTLYVYNQNISSAVEDIKEHFEESDIRNQILSFIQESPKGIIKRS
jgi:UDP-N-acetylglucosamine acyltransferase